MRAICIKCNETVDVADADDVPCPECGNWDSLIESDEQFKPGDKVIVKGLDMAFVVACYLSTSFGHVVKLFIKGESAHTMHSIIHARPEVLLLNNEENCKAEGWI